MIVKVAIIIGAAVPLTAATDDRDLHRECAELIWQGGRVIESDGTSRPPASFDELLTLPAHCPELGTNELLQPRR